MLISQILRDKPIQEILGVKPGSKVAAAAALLSEKKIGGVLVADSSGGRPFGIVTERDIVRELGKRGAVCLEDKVDDIMTRDLITCEPGDRAIRVLQVMTEKRFRHMPVMDGDKLVGLVSIGDVVKARLESLT